MSEKRYTEGFYVFGPTTSDYRPHLWMFPTEKAAIDFAEHICKDTYEDYLVLRKVGRFVAERPVLPVKFIEEKS